MIISASSPATATDPGWIRVKITILSPVKQREIFSGPSPHLRVGHRDSRGPHNTGVSSNIFYWRREIFYTNTMTG